MPELSAKAAAPEELDCGNSDDDELCDGCTFKGRKQRTDGKLDVVEALLLASKLHAATVANDVDKIRILVAKGADVNAMNEDLCTAVWVATKHHNVAALEALLAFDPKPNVKTPQAGENWTPVYVASKYGHTGPLRMLIDAAADVHTPDKQQQSPLWIAAKEDRADVIRLLVEAGAEVNKPNKHLQSPAHAAASQNSAAALKVLLADGEVCTACFAGTCKYVNGDARCTVCSMSRNGAPSMAGRWSGEGGTFKRYCSVDIDNPNEAGESPVYAAAKNDSAATLKMLINAHANIDQQDECGRSPLFAAAQRGFQHVVLLLINAGADLDACDEMGRTPVYAAAAANEVDTMVELVAAGANVEMPDIHQKTPVWIAAAHKCKATLSRLIACGANLNAAGPGRSSPVCAAVMCNSTETLKMLLSARADVEARNKYGKSALDVALEQGKRAAAELLREHGAQPSICPIVSEFLGTTGTPAESGLVTIRASPDAQNLESTGQVVLFKVSPVGNVFLCGGPDFETELLKIQRRRLVVTTSKDAQLAGMFVLKISPLRSVETESNLRTRDARH